MLSEDSRAIARWLAGKLIVILLLVCCLYAGSLDVHWRAGWAYTIIFAAIQALGALILLRNSRELVIVRSRIQDNRGNPDRIPASVMAIWGPVIIWLIAGFDARWGWSSIAIVWRISGLGFTLLGSALTLWAMVSNPFFSGILRIEKTPDHHTVSLGPYRLIRHPGYAGAAAFTLAAPLALESLFSMIPAIITLAVIIWRTAKEDNALAQDLSGYKEYQSKTRYRLIPYIW